MAARIKLSSIPTGPPGNFDKEEALKDTEKLVQEMAALQNILFAEKKHSLLIVLQGMDASGKDGTIRKVFTGINPMGCNVSAFKMPSEEEAAHDFLWRIHKNAPARGMIQIFNRSHYESVLIERVHKLITKDQAHMRFDHINNFERLLQENGTTILKFYLHISKAQQLKNLKERLSDVTKKWKHSPSDMKERRFWDGYMKAYESAIHHCSPQIPWHVIPSDHNWYREYLVAKIIVGALKKMDLKYPELNW